MPPIRLRLHFSPKRCGDRETVETIQFEDTWTVKKALEQIHGSSKALDFAFYQILKCVDLNSEDAVEISGRWLDPERELQYYSLCDNADVQLRYRMRELKIQLLDNSVKSMIVDESLPIKMLMPLVCENIPGVTNAEEYSLVRFPTDETDAAANRASSFLQRISTIFRDISLEKNKQNIERLRRKLKRNADLDWVDLSKTLEDQSVTTEEMLLFLRKSFRFEQMVKSNDSMELNFVYVMTRDDIINGTHPVTETQACAFAGLQCQIEFGDYVESRGTLNLKKMLPRKYFKQKGVEKRISMEHRRHLGNSASEAKIRYVSNARSLDTYGGTFFVVEELLSTKFVPRLLGVTKDSVLLLDKSTKEVREKWPFTMIKEWSFISTQFKLNFGDFADEYGPVRAVDGKKIVELIVSYIDIIQRSSGHNSAA